MADFDLVKSLRDSYHNGREHEASTTLHKLWTEIISEGYTTVSQVSGAINNALDDLNKNGLAEIDYEDLPKGEGDE